MLFRCIRSRSREREGIFGGMGGYMRLVLHDTQAFSGVFGLL